MVHMGNMSPVTHTHFSTKERACLRRQPAQRKIEPRENRNVLAKAQRLGAGTWQLSKPF